MVSLSSCTGESGEKNTSMEFYKPDSIRQVLALENSELQVRIALNYGVFQDFIISGNGSTATVMVSGVLPNEENFIHIRWSEILEGYPVELSVQTQRFIEQGGTLIDASHDHTQFDYDGDGASNLAERMAGTCVWSDTETCSSPGQPTGNLLLNGDFSDGTQEWWPSSLSGQNGELCFAIPRPTVTSLQMGYSRRFRIEERSRYKISFDVRAQTNSSINVLLLLPESNGATLFEESVEVGNVYETNTIYFTNSNNGWDDVAFAFTVDTESENNYCLDNISIERDGSS